MAVIVRTGAKKKPVRHDGMLAALPVTIITAMVSPMARPTPSMTAVIRPGRAAGNTTRQMVCHWVAPMASAPSRYSLGTA
ncbi:MAG: hypothetical protein R2851_13180 [Caldilineaceae bacterium]